jgi:hypothetical protein
MAAQLPLNPFILFGTVVSYQHQHLEAANRPDPITGRPRPKRIELENELYWYIREVISTFPLLFKYRV